MRQPGLAASVRKPKHRPRTLMVGGPAHAPSHRLRTSLTLRVTSLKDSSRHLRDWQPEVVVLGPDLSRSQVRNLLAELEGGATQAPAVVWVAGDGPGRSDPLLSRMHDVAFGRTGDAELVNRVHLARERRLLAIEAAGRETQLLELRQRIESLSGRIADDLRLAGNVQRSLLPAPLSHAQLELAREFIPFREIGGDYYDFISLGHDRVALALGDVMGKGIPAALLAATLSAAVRSQIQVGNADPEQVVARVNQLFWEVTPTGLFATLFFGVLDFSMGTLEYVNAGHHYPFRVRANGDVEDLAEGGTVLGLMEGASYQPGFLEIETGDLFVLYSDGVIDRLGCGDELYGIDRLKEAAAQVRRDSARICLYSILGDVQGWSGGGHADDDATLIVAKVR
jgi:serine phosphatase RsbU (regulator of sigma subunit)